MGWFGLTGHEDITNREWTFTNWTTKRLEIVDGTGFLTFDTLQVDFTIERKAYWYTVNLMVPAIFMWVLSYASLYVDPAAAPARVAMIVLPMLILITLSNRAFGYVIRSRRSHPLRLLLIDPPIRAAPCGPQVQPASAAFTGGHPLCIRFRANECLQEN